MTPPNYRYYAFISYSRKDEKSAKWLQKHMEAYRLPTVLQKQNEALPNKIKVFRDKTDIVGGGSVERALSRELRDSKKLIVVCSPASAKSEYVEYEVKSFLELGHSDEDILTFVIEGKIQQGAEDDCYTPTLHKLNINAADVNADGKRNAFIRLLSGLLGIKYDDIKKREQSRRKCKIIAAAVAGIFAALFLFKAVWFFTPHKYYYKGYVEHWAIPQGLGQAMSELDAQNLGEYYEITERYGKPVKLVHKNSLGQSTPELADKNGSQNRPMVARYIYKEKYSLSKDLRKWRLQEVWFTTRRQNPNDDEPDARTILKYNWDKSCKTAQIGFYSRDRNTGNITERPLASDFLAEEGVFNYEITDLFDTSLLSKIFIIPLFRAGGAIYQYNALYDENGLLASAEFLNKAGQSTHDINGIEGFFYEYNQDYTIAERFFKYAEGSEHLREENQTENSEALNDVPKYKMYENKFSYDGSGKLEGQMYESFDGSVTAAKIDYQNANKVITFYIKSAGEQYFDVDTGLFVNGWFSKAEISYDKLGNIVYVKFYNSSPQFEKMFFHEYRAYYNNSGIKIYQQFLDSNGNLHSPEVFGYAEYIAQADIDGEYETQGGYFDANKKRVAPNGFKWAYFEIEEDDVGLRRVYYSADGKFVAKGAIFLSFNDGV